MRTVGILLLACGALRAADAVDLTGSWITDADLQHLADSPAPTKIVLAHTKITDAGLERLKSLRGVRELSCYFCEYITEDGIAHLAGWKELEVLNLHGTKVTSKVFDALAKLTSLRSLDISHAQLEDEGFEQLAALPKLDRLAMGGNRLDGSALVALKRFPALRHLDVSGTQRVDSGLWGLPLTDTNLQRIGELTALRSLNLSGANLAGRDLDRPGHPEAERTELRNLSRLKTLVNLESLDLSHTPVTPEALDVARALPKLRELKLGLTPKLTEEIVEKLRRDIPRCRIVR